MTKGYPGYNAANALRGLLIYGSGDTLAALILGEFSLARMVGMSFIGATLYALEVPNWFHWIDRQTQHQHQHHWRSALQRTGLALLYFNPLWIARHLLFIHLFSGGWQQINSTLLSLGLYSFIANIPIALIANYTIQNRLPPQWRFSASALFSACMAIYYALAPLLFGGNPVV